MFRIFWNNIGIVFFDVCSTIQIEICISFFYINLNLIILPLKSQTQMTLLDIIFEEKRVNGYIVLNSVDWKNKKNLRQNYRLRILEKYLYSENFSSDIIFRLINLSSFLSINQVSLFKILKIKKILNLMKLWYRRIICDKVNYCLRILEKYLSENFPSDIIFRLITLSSFLSINQVFLFKILKIKKILNLMKLWYRRII